MNWLQGIEEREKKATEGPWDREEVENFLLALVYRYQKEFHQSWMRNGTVPTASFIAHARTDIPDLLEFIAEALPVMEWAETGMCVFCSGKIKSDDSCVHTRARAWIAKHGKESL